MVFDVRRYLSASGKDGIRDWLDKLHDARAAVRITMRIDRLMEGNFGDCKFLREGVWELRIDYGPGYRIYFAKVGKTCVVLLCGGDKRKQTSDITRAVGYLQDYQRRMKSL